MFLEEDFDTVKFDISNVISKIKCQYGDLNASQNFVELYEIFPNRT